MHPTPGHTSPTTPDTRPPGLQKKDPFWPPCHATTKRNTPCKFPARRQSQYCINHDPTYREQQQQHRQRGTENARKARNKPQLQLYDLDLTDRATIQALLETILNLELRGQITQSRTRNTIRLLSLASRNLRNSEHGWVRPHELPHTRRYLQTRTRLQTQLSTLPPNDTND